MRGLSVWLFGLSVVKGEGEGVAEGQLSAQGGEGQGKLGSRQLWMMPLFCVLRMHWVVNVDGAALDCQPRGDACNNVLCGCMPHKHTRLLLLILS